MSTSFASPTRASESRSRPVNRHRPSTPTSASSVNLSRRSESPSRIPNYDYSAANRRKRSRADSGTPLQYTYATSATSIAYSHRSPIPSPLPLANTRYRLAGGSDTPTTTAAARFETQNDSPDAEPRRRWSSAVGDRPQNLSTQFSPRGPLSRDRNGHKRTHSLDDEITALQQQDQQESWRRYVLRVAGGVAGKVWQFSTGAFTGFTAGGGAAYAMTDAAPQPFTTPLRREPWVRIERARDSPVPGAFPIDDELEDHNHHDSLSDQSATAVPTGSGPPPAKRLQTRQGSDWVLVDHEQVSTPKRQPLRPSSRASLGRPQRMSTPRIVSGSRGKAVRYPSLASPLYQQHHLGESSTGVDRRASFASPRSPQHSPSSHQRTTSSALADPAHTFTPTSPYRQTLTPRASQNMFSASPSPNSRPSLQAEISDVQRWSAKKAREERQADASMRKLNQQLKTMIREGKEALATKFEVSADDTSSYYDEDESMVLEDEGFSEADYERAREGPRSVKSGW